MDTHEPLPEYPDRSRKRRDFLEGPVPERRRESTILHIRVQIIVPVPSLTPSEVGMELRQTLVDRMKIILRNRTRSSRLLSRSLDLQVLRNATFFASAALGAITEDPIKARTLLDVRRNTGMSYDLLSRLYDLTRDVNIRGLEGSLVQCGVWKGGSAGVLVAASAGGARELWLFDSWEGLPPPSPGDTAATGAGATERMYTASVSDVQDFLTERFEVPLSRVHFEKGLFEYTIPQALGSIGPIALLDIDCGLFESTATCLRLLFPQMVPHGNIVIEDYNYWTGAKRATDEFLDRNGRHVHKLLETSLSLYLERVE
jgi:O-methyltransferase